MRRRSFLQSLSAGLIVSSKPFGSATAQEISGSPLKDFHIGGKNFSWTFVGLKEWAEGIGGVINNPTWRFATNDLLAYWPHETEDRQRQDFAYLPEAWLTDFDLSVRVKLYLQSTNGQIIFRAQDSRRFYVVKIRNVYERDVYELTLWTQDDQGLRRRLGEGLAGKTNLRTAESQRPKWDTVRVKASGPLITVWLNNDQVIKAGDSTYVDGVVGLGALGRIQFSDFSIRGKLTRSTKAWKVIPGEAPRYVYPFSSDAVDLTKPTKPRMSWPTGATINGEILLLRAIPPQPGFSAGTMLVRSKDNGKTWSSETYISGFQLLWPFQHRDGRLSALTTILFDDKGQVITEMGTAQYKAMDQGKLKIRQEPMLVYSDNQGRTWGKAHPFLVKGKPLSSYGNFWVYSGLRRLSDGSILWTPYSGKTENTVAEKRTNQTFVLRSEDDGKTWSVPVPVETSRKDTNEASAAELANGDLLIFMRSIRSPYLWKARSKDKGRTWSPLEKTAITLDCPNFIRTSKGLLVLQTRGGDVQVSPGDGKIWGPVWNVGYCVHMGCLLEATDGALLLAHLDAGFASITKVRAFRFVATPQRVFLAA